jgi:hypothetical protein
MLPKFADSRDPNSLASRMRGRRNQQFLDAIREVPRPLTIVDVGGRQAVWESMGFADRNDVHITLINIEPVPSTHRNVISVLGDARDMHVFHDRQFDVVFSNSVIEHLGTLDEMQKMAREIKRISKRYFIQTPYLYFPIEPHFVFPFFQFLPVPMQVYLVRHFNLGWIRRIPDRVLAERQVKSIKLISKTQMQALFPDAEIFEEKIFGLTKSLVACKI